MKRWVLLVLLLCPMLVQAQGDTDVTAEVIGQANLRAAPGTDNPLVGEMAPDVPYPVIGRSEFFPWYLLGDPATYAPKGWVFDALVTVRGDINQVPFSEVVVGQPTATPFVTATASPPQSTPTQHFAVSGTVSGEINLRYGPGVDYDRVGVAEVGQRFEITGYHTQVPWVQIAYPDSPNGHAWVLIDLLEIEGNIYNLPSTGRLTLNLPTLTAAQPVLEAVNVFGETPVPLSAEFRGLGNQIWNMMLGAGFDPATSKFGAFYLMDLQTGEAITFGNEYAFSGMSISKIAILTDFFSVLNDRLTPIEADTIANMMICSENTSSNAVLRMIGGGDEYAGARDVTEFLNRLGLEQSFMVAPYHIEGVSTPRPVRQPVTSADQASANPDYSNQFTVDETGWLLGSIYQCALDESGPLLQGAWAENFTPGECRNILTVMSQNRIGALIEAGVPEGTRVAHKHGWIDETHGDAGIVFTPGGDYVLVMALHSPEWLDFTESFPLMAEISRAVYNFYNPDAPLEAIRDEVVSEECDIPQSLIGDLMSAN